MHAISAAHPTLPIPSYVRVTNLANRRSMIVRVNDRGPFKDDRIIDLSSKSAELLGFRGNGLARVRVEYVGRAALDGSDDRKLMATLRHDGRPAPAPSNVLLASSGGPFVPAAAEPIPQRRLAQVPSPEVRPFELGRYSAVETSPYRPTYVATAPQLAAREGPRTAGTAAPGAFVPAVISGRGLY
jgi:rare lipoprotein A